MKTSRQEQDNLREQGKKRCSKCQEILPLDKLPKDRQTRDGYASVCKKCKYNRERKRRQIPHVKHRREEQRKQWLSTKIQRTSYTNKGIGNHIHGFIYVFKWGDFFKIGRARRPHARVRSFNKFLPFEGSLVHVIETSNMVYAEHVIHNKFSKYRQGGEWFMLSDSDISYLLNLTSIE